MRSRITWAATWLAGALLAAAGITFAVSQLGTDLLGPASPVLTATQVRQQLASQPASSAPAGPPASAPPGGPASRTSFGTAAGMVWASCSGGLATLTSWTVTTPGYRTDSYVQGPAATTWITFKSASSEQTVTVTCRGGRPHHVISNDDRGGRHGGQPASTPPATSPASPGPGGDDHGGGRSRGGSGGGGGGHGGDG